ncbi:hypothetical protein BBP40_003361 [Aspergillus hancockii]|nr:hypothetical protein BBP40_003361 [Aspergillus hancockii]
MSFTSIDHGSESQDGRSTSTGRKDDSHSQRIEVLNDGTHHHFLGTAHVGILRRLSDAFQRYKPKQEPNHRPPVATESIEESSTAKSFRATYGKCEKILHYGNSSSVRLHHRPKDTKDKESYAVKVFHHYSQKTIDHPLRSELWITSHLKHPNVIRMVESLENDRGELCLVMEYCGGGDLQSLIVTSGKLTATEADCFFKQLMRAIVYLHDQGIAHQNLNPENILLTASGTVKVVDFGEATCVPEKLQRQPSRPRESFGSILYQPPEAISRCSTDPRPGDVWAAALIYIAMRTGRLLWKVASQEDREFGKYLSARNDEDGYLPIQGLHTVRRQNVIYAMLHPNPGNRLLAWEALRSEWLDEVLVCDAGNAGMW